MKALVLAAGCGRRMWPLTAERPKCLLELCGVSILQHQLLGLQRIHADAVVVVCGFGAESVRQHLVAHGGKLAVRTTYNPFYSMADNLVSLWTARAELDDEVVLLNGDAVYHPGVFDLLDTAASQCCLLLARKERYTEDDMKVCLHQGRVAAISKDLEAARTHGASIGALRLSREGALQLREELDRCIRAPRALDSHFPAVIQRLADGGRPVEAMYIGDLAWADVDTPADLQHVRDRFHLFQDRPARGRQVMEHDAPRAPGF